jgi:hypothetical protein
MKRQKKIEIDPEFKKGRAALKDILEPCEEVPKEMARNDSHEVKKEEIKEASFENTTIKESDKNDFLLKDSRNRLKDILSMQNNGSAGAFFGRKA